MTKHIEIDYHLVREKNLLGFLKLLLSSSNQLTHITKSLSPTSFLDNFSKLGMVYSHSQLKEGLREFTFLTTIHFVFLSFLNRLNYV